MRLGGDGDGEPPLPHTFIVVVCFVFLHSLFSIKKPFLQPVSDAHSRRCP